MAHIFFDSGYYTTKLNTFYEGCSIKKTVYNQRHKLPLPVCQLWLKSCCKIPGFNIEDKTFSAKFNLANEINKTCLSLNKIFVGSKPWF